MEPLTYAQFMLLLKNLSKSQGRFSRFHDEVRALKGEALEAFKKFIEVRQFMSATEVINFIYEKYEREEQ